MRLRYLSFLTLLFTSCGDDSQRPAEVWPSSVAPTAVWAGGEVSFEPFSPPAGESRVFANGVPVEVLSDTGSALRVLVPDSVVGPLTFRFGTPEGRLLGSVVVGGVVSYDAVPTEFNSEVWVTPWGGPASVLVGGAPRRVLRYWPGSGRLETILDGYTLDWYLTRAPGVTPDPNVLLFSNWAFYPALPRSDLWQVDPSVQLVDSIGINVVRHGARFRNGVVIRSTHHEIESYKSSREVLHREQFEESNGMQFSPDGRLLAVTSYAARTVVYDSAGLPRYQLPVGATRGAFFTPAGDTLFVAGSPGKYWEENAVLYVANAEDGAYLAQVDLGRKWVVDALRADPTAPWIYVTISPLADAEVVVIDRRDLTIAGRVRLTGLAGLSWTSCCPAGPEIAAGIDGVFAFGYPKIVRLRRP
jgi:hypothetical protein